MQKQFLIFTGGLFCVLTVYAAMPPVGKVPLLQLKCFKPYSSVGCGVSTLNKYTSSGMYRAKNPSTGKSEDLIATPSLLRELDSEAKALGLTKTISAGGSTVYRRTWRTLLTRRGFSIRVYPDGKISRVSTNQKWPYL